MARLRSPYKVHLLSWMITLDKDRCIPCLFRNCRFMALDVDEMASHYPICNADNVSVLVECIYCERGTDKLEKLLYHKVNSHSYKASEEEIQIINNCYNILRRKKISFHLKKAWQSFLENKKYLKCLIGNCNYVTESLTEMEEHFLRSCSTEEKATLKYICDFCGGRTKTAERLQSHKNAVHVHGENPRRCTIENRAVNEDIILCWSYDIQTNKEGQCLIPGCLFVDNSMYNLIRHYTKICTGVNNNYVVCPICNHWLLNNYKLLNHQRYMHGMSIEEDVENSPSRSKRKRPFPTNYKIEHSELEQKHFCDPTMNNKIDSVQKPIIDFSVNEDGPYIKKEPEDANSEQSPGHVHSQIT